MSDWAAVVLIAMLMLYFLILDQGWPKFGGKK